MKPYFFGYLFVRLAKLLATLLFVAGLLSAAFTYRQAALEARFTHYQPSETLRTQLFSVARLEAVTQEIVASYGSADQEPRPPRMAPGEIETLGTVVPSMSAEFPRLTDSLARVRANDAAMKSYLLNRFETAMADIRRQLLSHAQELNGPPTPTPVPTVPASAPEPPSLTNVCTPRAYPRLISGNVSPPSTRRATP